MVQEFTTLCVDHPHDTYQEIIDIEGAGTHIIWKIIKRFVRVLNPENTLFLENQNYPLLLDKTLKIAIQLF